ncbi:MAG: hypothetical protein IKV81_05120 [Clostridia bacterium]|nr:hypothetical protein [Clostridia bacterium]
MANMFSGNQEKKIPKDFKDCYKTDSITKNLWLWCERLEKWGKILFWILIVIGVIDTIMAGINAHQLIEEIGAETVEEIREASAELGIEIPTVFEALVNNLLSWTLYSFLEYCAYHILALLIGSLASIVQHTKITANISLYNSAKAEGVREDIETEDDVTFKQTSCTTKKKKLNRAKKEKYKNQFECEDDTPPIFPDGCWRCMGCGEILSDDKTECGSDITNDKNSCHVCGTLIDSTVDGLEIFCPECKNDLKFMGYTEDDFKQEQTCPFCNAELKYDKGKK